MPSLPLYPHARGPPLSHAPLLPAPPAPAPSSPPLSCLVAAQPSCRAARAACAPHAFWLCHPRPSKFDTPHLPRPQHISTRRGRTSTSTSTSSVPPFFFCAPSFPSPSADCTPHAPPFEQSGTAVHTFTPAPPQHPLSERHYINYPSPFASPRRASWSAAGAPNSPAGPPVLESRPGSHTRSLLACAPHNCAHRPLLFLSCLRCCLLLEQRGRARARDGSWNPLRAARSPFSRLSLLSFLASLLCPRRSSPQLGPTSFALPFFRRSRTKHPPHSHGLRQPHPTASLQKHTRTSPPRRSNPNRGTPRRCCTTRASAAPPAHLAHTATQMAESFHSRDGNHLPTCCPSLCRRIQLSTAHRGGAAMHHRRRRRHQHTPTKNTHHNTTKPPPRHHVTVKTTPPIIVYGQAAVAEGRRRVRQKPVAPPTAPRTAPRDCVSAVAAAGLPCCSKAGGEGGSRKGSRGSYRRRGSAVGGNKAVCVCVWAAATRDGVCVGPKHRQGK